MKIRVTPDAEYAAEVRRRIKENDGYCPCNIVKSAETKCMCKEFREQIKDKNFEGFCHCMLYYKSKD